MKERYRLILKDSSKQFDISEDKAHWTKEALRNRYDYYGSEWEPEYSQRYHVKIDPKDFLNLTTSVGASNLKLGENKNILEYFEELDEDRFNEESTDMFLEFISKGNNRGVVVGHEGRHRMFGLMLKGVRSVDITLICEDDDFNKYKPKDFKSITLQGQYNKSVEVKLNNIKTFSYKNINK